MPARRLQHSCSSLGDRVLIRQAAKETKTASGIYLPSDKTAAPSEGEVVAVGPGLRDVNGSIHPCSLKKGDKVLLPNYGGSKVEIDGEDMTLYREDDILGKYDE